MHPLVLDLRHISLFYAEKLNSRKTPDTIHWNNKETCWSIFY